MYSAWTHHLKSPEEKDRFKGSVVAAKPVLDRVKEILKGMEVGLGQDEVNKAYYEQPSWAYRQAHNNGYRHCINTVLAIIDLDKQVIEENK